MTHLFELTNDYLITGYYQRMKERLGKNCVRQGLQEAQILSQVIRKAGHGNHIEIGSLYGASALICAFTKEHYKLDGKIYCVDPQPRGIKDSARKFGLSHRIVVVKERSHPFPERLRGLEFVSGYIDGDHRYDNPSRDWENLCTRVRRYIVFDDYNLREPAVVMACKDAFCTIGWIPVLIKNSYVVMQSE